MTRVIYISYYFPPVGGAGVQRAAKFVRYLPQFGVTPIVVTGPGRSANRWTPSDATLESELPTGVEVLPVAGPEPAAASGWAARGTRWLRLPTEWERWWSEQVTRTGARVWGANVIFCSMSPFQSARAAARLAARLGLPWVADLRDPWALDEMTTWPTRLHRQLEVREMRRALSSAALVIMNTSTAAEAAAACFSELRERVVSLPNGFDAADFAGPEPERARGIFRIVHTGYLHTALGLEHSERRVVRRLLGGAVGEVDFLARSHVFLLEALDGVVADDASLASQLELVLAGVLSDADRAAVGARPYVRMPGYLSHAESIRLVRSADLLFLPMHDLPPGRRATIVPGKTYEYLASGRPVLAAIPDGDARELVAAAGTGLLCRPRDIECMTRTIRRGMELWRAGETGPELRREVLKPYERRALAEQLAGLLEQVAASGRRPAVA